MTNNPDDNALLAQFNFRNTEEQSEKLGLLMSMRNVDTVSEGRIIPRQVINQGSQNV